MAAVERFKQDRVFWGFAEIRYQFLGFGEALEFQVGTNYHRSLPSVVVYDVENLFDELTRRSKPPDLGEDEFFWRHWMAIEKVKKHWKDIETQLNPNAESLIETDSSYVVGEVNLDVGVRRHNSSGPADIVAIGRDLRIYVIEVGTSRKHKNTQVNKHIVALAGIFEMIPENFSGVVAKFSDLDPIYRMSFTFAT